MNREQVFAFKRFSDHLDILCARFLVKKGGVGGTAQMF